MKNKRSNKREDRTYNRQIKNYPLVSVGMPIYNEERFIRETLKSVLSQDYPNFEVIISENCSSDSTLEIVTSIAEMDSRVKIIRTSETVLSSANGRNAFLNSNGQFFIWVFGHDLLEPGYIRKCFDLLQENPNIILAYSRAAFIDMQGQRIGLCPGIDTRGCDPISRFFKVMWGIQYGYPQYGMMRRKILEEFILREPNKLPASDYLFLAELACLGEFAQVDEVLFNIRRMDDFGSWEHYMKKHLLIKQGASPIDIFLKMVREFNTIIERRLSSSGIVPYLAAALISCLYTKHVGILAGMLSTSISTQKDREHAERIMNQLAEASRQLTHIGLGLVSNIPDGGEIFKQANDSIDQNDTPMGNSAKQEDLTLFYNSLQHGEQLYSEGKVVEAMGCFTNIIKDTDNGSIRCQAFNDIGVIAHDMNDMKRAEQMFKSALSADSVNIDALMNLSELYITNGLHDEALKILEKALISHPGNEQFSEKITLCRNILHNEGALGIGKNNEIVEDTSPNHSMQQISRPETIIIDGVFFQMYRTGIARVWKSLLTQWAKTSFGQTLLVLDRNGTSPRLDGLRYRQIAAYDYNNTDTDRAMLQKICDEENASIFISTYYTTPLTTPSVFMGYDMIPEIAGSDVNHPMWREKHYGIRHAAHYIVISQNTANDLRRFFPDIAPSKITVAHTGVDFSRPPKDLIEAFKNQFGISKPYWLLVGGRGGYKNGILFFKAFERLGALRKDYAIVCTGPTGALEAEYAACVGNTDVFTLDLSDEHLQVAYAGAIALVYPSLYEGFGMPIIEAMACGCPVITSPSGSIPEVAGNAALLVNPGSVDEMLSAMKKVQKPKLRHSLMDMGIQRSQLYSWEKMADEVKNVLLRVAAEK